MLTTRPKHRLVDKHAEHVLARVLDRLMRVVGGQEYGFGGRDLCAQQPLRELLLFRPEPGRFAEAVSALATRNRRPLEATHGAATD